MIDKNIGKTINVKSLTKMDSSYEFDIWYESGAADFDKDYPELKSYCEKVSSQIPNYAKANGDGATAFGNWGGENFKKAVEKVKA